LVSSNWYVDNISKKKPILLFLLKIRIIIITGLLTLYSIYIYVFKDVHYSTKSIKGWPKIQFQIFHQDRFGRNELCKYPSIFDICVVENKNININKPIIKIKNLAYYFSHLNIHLIIINKYIYIYSTLYYYVRWVWFYSCSNNTRNAWIRMHDMETISIKF